MDVRKGGADFQMIVLLYFGTNTWVIVVAVYLQNLTHDDCSTDRYHLSLWNISCRSPRNKCHKNTQSWVDIFSIFPGFCTNRDLDCAAECMFVPVRVNSTHSNYINKKPSGILGRQEEVTAATPRLEGGKFTGLTAATQIKQQEANRLHSANWKTSLRLIYLESIAGSSSSGLTVSTISGDIPVACVCEKSYLNVDDRASSSISQSHPVSLQSPPFFLSSGSVRLSVLLHLQWNRTYLTNRDGCWENAHLK